MSAINKTKKRAKNEEKVPEIINSWLLTVDKNKKKTS